MNRKELIKKYSKRKYVGENLKVKEVAYNYAIDQILELLKSNISNDMVNTFIGVITESIRNEIKELDQKLSYLIGKGSIYEQLQKEIKQQEKENEQIKS